MKNNRVRWQSLILLVLGLNCGLSPLFAAPSLEEQQPEFRKEAISLKFPNVERGALPDTLNGGKRCSGCLTKSEKVWFRSILPSAMKDSEAIATANTTSSAPSLWWYIPQNQAVKGELSIFQQDGSLVYTQDLSTIDNQGGLLRLDLPEGLLQSGIRYWWDFALACDENDRSGDTYLFGELQYHNIETVTMGQDPQTKNVLRTILTAPDSVLTIGNADSRIQLAQELDSDFSAVEDRLRQHYISLQNDYVRLNNRIYELEKKPTSNWEEMNNLKTEQSVMVQELAQLAALFGMWADMVDLLASHRTKNPEEWRALLGQILPLPDLERTGFDPDEMVRLLTTADNLRDRPKKVNGAGTKC
ncbi:MAG: DUF928 domain-containing protein [Limnothrix sp. RL_2_0]|nr:DUF928 domain-containing protein [Limnothrix sp. RL_2_0]